MKKSPQQLDSELVWHPFTPLEGAQSPLLIAKGRGAYIYTPEGRAILDAISSWWVNIHGHAHPAIAAAIAKQASVLEQVIFAGFTHEPAIRLAEKLVGVLPGPMSKLFFSDDGSTAVEVALKLAIQYWHNTGQPKNRIVAIEGAYHGDTFGAMAIGERGGFTAPFGRHLFEVDFIPFPSLVNRQEVAQRFSGLVETGEVAAFIFEPLVQGAGGMRMYPAEVLDQLLQIAKEHEVICIADEVMTGFGRTGTLFATDRTQLKPDIICLSKGITGGFMPLGVTAVSQSIVAAFSSTDFNKTFFHGHSFTANPLACAAALASFDLLMEKSCEVRRQLIASKHEQFLSGIKGHGRIKDVRMTGTILAIELDTGNTSYFNNIRKKIMPFFLERNILLRPLGNVIYILPPYVITPEELDSVYQAIVEFLEAGF